MVELKFRPYVRPHVLAYTFPDRVNTIYIPTDVLEDVTTTFQEDYHLSPEQAKVAAGVFIEDIYPETLAHETAHLALARIAREEGLPITKTMDAYHHPMIKKLEDRTENLAARHAVKRAQAQSQKLKKRRD